MIHRYLKGHKLKKIHLMAAVLYCLLVIAPAVAAADGITFQDGLPPELVIDTDRPLDEQLEQLDSMVKWVLEQRPPPAGGVMASIRTAFSGPEGPPLVTSDILEQNLGELQGMQVSIVGLYTVQADAEEALLETGTGTLPVTLAGGVEPKGFGEAELHGVPTLVTGLVEAVDMPPSPSLRATEVIPAGWLAMMRIARIHEIQGDFQAAVTAFDGAGDVAHAAGSLFSGHATVRAADLAIRHVGDEDRAQRLYNKAWNHYGTPDRQGNSAYVVWQPADGAWDHKILHNLLGPILDELNREGFWYRVIAGFVALGGGNPAIGVIILALAVRLMIWPLTRKQLESAQAMQALQPQVKALQEKYVDDKKKFQEEFWKLCQSKGVNPLGGCLPMLIQLPILIMLYRGIRDYIWHFDHASFLWIPNLAAPDMMLLVAYTISMIMFQKATQRMQPAAAMSPQQVQQQQMMTWMMPIMFFFFFQGFPAAFLLYWLSSNIFYFGEQYIHKATRKPAPSGDEDTQQQPDPKPTGGLASGMVKLLSAKEEQQEQTEEEQRASYADRKAAQSGKKARKQSGKKKRK